MKVKVGNTGTEIEVGQFKQLDKGSLKGVFTLIEYPTGRKTLECRYFEQNDSRWFSFPQKEIKYTDGRKSEYIPYVCYMNKEYLEQLKSAVLEAITAHNQKGNNDQKNSQAGQANPVQSDASNLWF